MRFVSRDFSGVELLSFSSLFCRNVFQPQVPGKLLSFLVLGLIFMTTGAIWCLIVALFASSFGRRLHRSAVASKRLRRVNGILFILLGLKLATAKLNF